MGENFFEKQSLEINLFFLRIMKEHSLFLAVAFIPNHIDGYRDALRFNEHFNSLLNSAVELSRGVVDINNDAVTDYTLDAENATSRSSNLTIDTALTQNELALRNQSLNRISSNELSNEIRKLNDQVIHATRNLIRFKTKILDSMLSCNMMFNIYPLLIEHIRREAILFVDILSCLQSGQSDKLNSLIENELFWNKIMEEHSEFIRGLLDPTEVELMKVANDFAIKYENLNTKVYNTLNNQNNIAAVTKESYNLTKEIQAFNTQATKALINCEVRSILNPLLADHVLRESNHYLRLLDAKRKH